jgi:hypothetical protein
MYTLLPLETTIFINPTSDFRGQGYRDGKPMPGVITRYHPRIILSELLVGTGIEAQLFCYIVRWSDGHTFGYRAMDILGGAISNESMVHVLHQD